jgi:hypothetical protein
LEILREEFGEAYLPAQESLLPSETGEAILPALDRIEDACQVFMAVLDAVRPSLLAAMGRAP